MQTLLGHHWHHLQANEVVELLDTHAERGLDLFAIKHRQEHFGPNVITPAKGKSAWQRFFLQFHNPLIYILLASTVITAVLKDVVDALIIGSVVLVNAIIGYIQESRAEKAMHALAQTMTTEATVLRAGQPERVPAANLVPGDIVLLQAGDKVPADLRLLKARDLQSDESALTGESLPVAKDAGVQLLTEAVLADRRNMVYASTLVTYGQATGVTVATGDNTEIGRISQLISSAESLQTPLTRKMAQFSQILVYLILGLAGITLVIGLLRGQPLVDVFYAAVALAVGSIPEGLPAAVTIALAIGVSRMARRRAIMRKLPTVETLGSTTVICSDKTGTLTQNQMTVQEIVTGRQLYQVSGSGYAPEGRIEHNASPVMVSPESALHQVLLAGLLANDSQLRIQEGRWNVQGDPTEGALLTSAAKAGLDREQLEAAWPRLDTIPFDSRHQYMVTLHGTPDDTGRVAFVKGSVEAILERCTTMLDADGTSLPLDPTVIHDQVEQLAGAGLRVLAFARAAFPATASRIDHDDVARGLTFLGLQGMIDPPRPEAIAAVQACHQAGIRVKMITGDHAVTALAIARQIGLTGDHSRETQVLTGREIANFSDRELIDVAERTSVFARVSPEQKLRLVEALQARGHVVAMTGDGVNDAPALKQANIGIAMGITGTEVSKEASDMVLTDDNFATIEAAVEEGRSVFDNLTKMITWMLPTNLGQGLVLLTAILLGVTLPILPGQVLWINLTTAGVLGLVLALEPREPGIMRRAPRAPDAPILSRALVMRILLVGAMILVGAFGLFEWALTGGATEAVARTIAVNTVVMIQLFYVFNCRSLTQSLNKIGWFSNPWVYIGTAAMVVLQLFFTYAPIMHRLFGTAPIDAQAWIPIVALGIVAFVVIEVIKWIGRRGMPAQPVAPAPSANGDATAVAG